MKEKCIIVAVIIIAAVGTGAIIKCFFPAYDWSLHIGLVALLIASLTAADKVDDWLNKQWEED